MALAAPFAGMARSTNRSTHPMGITRCQLRNVTADRRLICQGYGSRATWLIWAARFATGLVPFRAAPPGDATYPARMCWIQPRLRAKY